MGASASFWHSANGESQPLPCTLLVMSILASAAAQVTSVKEFVGQELVFTDTGCGQRQAVHGAVGAGSPGACLINGLYNRISELPTPGL